jgi:hypothetical protein
LASPPEISVRAVDVAARDDADDLAVV